MTKKKVIFCDFDGTITEKDNIVSIMKEFGGNGWEETVKKVLGGEISIQEGVGKMFASVPSSKKEEIIRFVLTRSKLRGGFEDIIQYAKNENIEFYVVSGGIDFFVYPYLEDYISNDHVYCNGSDFTEETIKITWPNECDEHCENGCGCCKPSILRKWDSDEFYKIVIGDSITDVVAAKRADEVFARDFLIEKCRDLNISFTPFETFHDIIGHLEKKKEAVS
ncbi:2-hydroxy-3-keto-5-methylthiopentenyl-1-phosphate phosphatase [Fictibacillus aquaticus]|uniref:2-hydroxy-3-keto-5-methylthiopentenyl-1-phosphate phosphatase n=1 Tax=Fictibacillus aquaticus TaxID=2021314 RepID=A0A235FDV7_9BACL|nr:2-hydroxy-3-keto-5-methylthiopentenyl-1-phosphate phosphatase [Fictibacillus aquaticus]OYD59107.1 2-hydroxy-3-keto-5-methylthiopentenyl-1-phosphate phosphatase [Fictibacillus aquaticus]